MCTTIVDFTFHTVPGIFAVDIVNCTWYLYGRTSTTVLRKKCAQNLLPTPPLQREIARERSSEESFCGKANGRIQDTELQAQATGCVSETPSSWKNVAQYYFADFLPTQRDCGHRHWGKHFVNASRSFREKDPESEYPRLRKSVLLLPVDWIQFDSIRSSHAGPQSGGLCSKVLFLCNKEARPSPFGPSQARKATQGTTPVHARLRSSIGSLLFVSFSWLLV